MHIRTIGMVVIAFVSFTASAEQIKGEHSSDELAAMWWQWVNSSVGYKSAPRDATGEYCNINQSGDVWFLAGSYSQNKVHRKCEIPAGKRLFFPVINWVMYPGKNKDATCSGIKAALDKIVGFVGSLEITLDDKNITDTVRRIATDKCFPLYPDSTYNEFIGYTYPAATDGYWVSLEPLGAGVHTLSFRGETPGFKQDIEYSLIIEGM